MNSTNNRQDDSIIQEALKEMQTESIPESEASETVRNALDEMKDDQEVDLQTPETTILSKQELTEQQLRSLREIDRMMGQFLDSLKAFDEKFAKMADSFFMQANTLAEKKNPTEDDFTEAVANIVIGGAIKGVGNIWQAFKTQQQLSQIKGILTREANDKLDFLQALYENNEKLWNITASRYDQSENFEDAQINFNQFRLQDYILSVNAYLISVYQEALNGNFTTLPFPSYYEINRKLLFYLLTSPKETSSAEATRTEHRRVIRELVNLTKESIVTNSTPNLDEFVLASDAQIMAVAIDAYLDVDFSKGTGEFTSENHPVVPNKLQLMGLFEELYGAAYDHPESALSPYVQENDSLTESLIHYSKVIAVEKEFEQRNILYNLNTLMAALVCFLGSMVHFGLAWYWGLTIGIVAWFIALKFSPFSSWEELCQEKALCIMRKLALDNLNKAGYIEMINFSELSSESNKIWLYILFGAIVGIIVPIPFGWLIGGILGAVLGGSKSSEISEDYNYDAITLGKTWKAQTVSAIFTALAVYYLYLLIF